MVLRLVSVSVIVTVLFVVGVYLAAASSDPHVGSCVGGGPTRLVGNTTEQRCGFLRMGDCVPFPITARVEAAKTNIARSKAISLMALSLTVKLLSESLR